MTKVMFICTGNICRSTMAEALLKDKLKKEDSLKHKIRVSSSGIFAQNDDMPTFTTVEAMNEYGINIKDYRATNIRSSKIASMDLILCSTNSHKNSIIQLYPNLRDKVFTLKEYVEFDELGEDIDIKDPWGYDIDIYRKCASEIEKCIDLLIEKLKQQGEESSK